MNSNFKAKVTSNGDTKFENNNLPFKINVSNKIYQILF